MNYRWTDRHGVKLVVKNVYKLEFAPSHVIFWGGDVMERVLIKAIHNDNVRKIEPE